MSELKCTKVMKKLDPGNVLASLRQLPDQCRQAWEETQKIAVPKCYEEVENIVVAGMGGSAFGARIVKSLYDGAEIIKRPMELVNEYWLPGYVNKKTLVVASSYSGNTEETLAVAREAKEKGAKILGITAGGQLGEFLAQNNFPAYIFNPIHNPSQQPRMGIGYMVIGLISLLTRLRPLPVDNLEIEKVIALLRAKTNILNETSPPESNLAKQLALKLRLRVPVFIIADFLEGATHAVRNIFHETAKQFTLYFSIPELNHHLLEGLMFPKRFKQFLLFIFVNSNIYDPRNIRRLQLTKEVVERNIIGTETLSLSFFSGLGQSLEFIQLGAWTAFYLAMLHRVDPAKIPWVDFFKEELK